MLANLGLASPTGMDPPTSIWFGMSTRTSLNLNARPSHVASTSFTFGSSSVIV